MTPIQQRLLNMLSWFHYFCVDNNIVYFAIGGTMIGAMRHQGFIPWDDDIDVAVPRTDYERLIHNFTDVVDGYFLESPYTGNPDYLYSYSKLYDTRTTLEEKTRIPCRRGVYIDIFPLDGIGDTYDKAKKNYKKFDRKNMFLMSRTCVLRNDRSLYKNASIIAARAIPKIFINEKNLTISLDQIAANFNDEKSTFVANLMGAYRTREITKREYFGQPTLYTFEGIKIFGPEKYDEYLSGIYNNWRELPPLDKRYTKHDYVVFDLDKSYIK